MSTCLSAIQNNYINKLPDKVPTKAAQGFIATVAISLIAGSATNVALLGGAIAVTATLIEAATRPIIKAVFAEYPLITKCIQICVPKMIALGAATALTPWIGVTYKITSVLISIIGWLALNDKFYERNVAMAQVL